MNTIKKLMRENKNVTKTLNIYLTKKAYKHTSKFLHVQFQAPRILLSNNNERTTGLCASIYESQEYAL